MKERENWDKGNVMRKKVVKAGKTRSKRWTLDNHDSRANTYPKLDNHNGYNYKPHVINRCDTRKGVLMHICPYFCEKWIGLT